MIKKWCLILTQICKTTFFKDFWRFTQICKKFAAFARKIVFVIVSEQFYNRIYTVMPEYLADQLTLFHPGRADCPHLSLLDPQSFSPSGITEKQKQNQFFEQIARFICFSQKFLYWGLTTEISVPLCTENFCESRWNKLMLQISCKSVQIFRNTRTLPCQMMAQVSK